MENSEYLPGGSKYAAKQDHTDPTLNKVRALLASADDPTYPPEVQDSYRAQAEALMFKYKIDALTVAGKPTSVLGEPQWRMFRLCERGNPYLLNYQSIASSIYSHCDVKGVFTSEGGYHTIHIVGMVPDLQYFELLFTSCLLAFASKMQPKYSSEHALEENIYLMRSAGMERNRIAKLCWPSEYAGKPLDHVNKTLTRKVSRIFVEEATKRGDDPSVLLGRGNDMKAFRASYAEGFCDTIWSRLLRMRATRAVGTHSVMLKNAADKVTEAFYDRYPGQRPTATTEEWVEPNADCPRCKQAKSGYCREHAYLKPSTAKPKPRPYSVAGAERGARAAESVDLGASGNGISAHGNSRAVEGR